MVGMVAVAVLLGLASAGAGHSHTDRSIDVEPRTPAHRDREREKIAVYYSGWQLVGQRPDQPTPGDVRNESRIRALVQRGFTHAMMEDGNLEVPLPLCLSVSVCLCLSVCLPACLSLCLSVSLCAFVSVRTRACACVFVCATRATVSASLDFPC